MESKLKSSEYLDSVCLEIVGLHFLKEELEDSVKLILSSSIVLTMGNGGSASTAQHLAQGLCDAGIPSICLSDNTSLITAIANDIGYNDIFLRQVELFKTKKVSIIAISVSGKSPNIIAAVDRARVLGIKTIGLIGFNEESLLKDFVDIPIVVSSKDFGVVEDCHLVISHLICRMVKESYGN